MIFIPKRKKKALLKKPYYEFCLSLLGDGLAFIPAIFISFTHHCLIDVPMKKFLLFTFLLAPLALTAQEFSYGFKAGLNFSRFTGPKEENAGEEVETFKSATGFHVGAGLVYRFTDHFGVKAEIIYSQKGGRIRFEAPSYFWLETANEQRILIDGNRRMSTNISNSYIDIPIIGYARFGPLEFGAGVNVGFLVGASAGGDVRISEGKAPNGADVETFSISQDFNYFTDEPGEALFEIPRELMVGPQTALLPNSLGAYYDFPDKEGNLFNILDLGLNAEVNLFVNDALYLGFRFNYGLLDVTDEEFDRSFLELDSDESFILRDDKDHNLSLQTSIGFSF